MPSTSAVTDARAASTEPDSPAARLPGWRTAALAGAAIGLAGLLATQRAVLRQPGYLVSTPALLYLVMLWWALGLATATLLVLAAPRRLAMALLLVAVILIHAVALTSGPRLSDDLYRYAWDGRVQATGIDPYRYGPLAPELTAVRDDWLFPNSAGCTADDPQPHCTRLNYPRAHTIYPPVAQAYFTAVQLLPGPPREHRLQLWASLLSLALVGLLMRMLVRRGRDPRHAAFYALTPLAGLDVGSDAHVDVLGALLVLGALALLTHGRRPPAGESPSLSPCVSPSVARGASSPVLSVRRAWLAGGLLGAAVAVKLYPVLVLAAMVGRRRACRPVALAGAAAAVVVLAYLPHVLAVGTGVLGFLPEYLRVEGYDQGSRFLLLAGLGVHGTAAKAVAAALLAAVTAAVLRTDPDRVPVERGALWLVGAAFLTATPAQPWYGVLVAALAVLAGRPEWLAVAAAAHPLYISLFTDLPGDAWTLRVGSYAIAAAIVFAAGLARRVPRASSSARHPQRRQPRAPMNPGRPQPAELLRLLPIRRDRE
ncbi:glycosyltransferase 87 family protein [Protofrankia coriariae]|uniref:glycosyltransferase 87 family protein n=1 Tax=Protofrankia coriariae TaxID=1562887 RepID=UPI000A31EA82|nr:glycosyltransferase 87 family protein [Protofrankia coriariae]